MNQAPNLAVSAAVDERPWVIEPVAYYLSLKWPKSRQPNYFDTSTLPGTRILEDNFEAIKEEILAYYHRHGETMEPNFTPYAWREEGWRTINLYSYYLRYPKSCALFPKLDAIVSQIPGMAMTQIAVLKPGVKLKAHFGDTNALIRSHMGIVVPGGLPELGMRVGREDRCWEEGKVFAIAISHRHFAWNLTDQARIALIVDVIRPDLFGRRYEIAANALAVIVMKLFATRIPILKKLPPPVTRAIRFLGASAFRARLWVQRALHV